MIKNFLQVFQAFKQEAEVVAEDKDKANAKDMGKAKDMDKAKDMGKAKDMDGEEGKAGVGIIEVDMDEVEDEDKEVVDEVVDEVVEVTKAEAVGDEVEVEDVGVKTIQAIMVAVAV